MAATRSGRKHAESSLLSSDPQPLAIRYYSSSPVPFRLRFRHSIPFLLMDSKTA